MEVYEIKDAYYCAGKEYRDIRKAVRAVIFDKEGNILAEETKKPYVFMLPGGKLEDDESVRDCVIRECAEECGLVVEPEEELFAIKEYYKDKIFYSTYVKCAIKGECIKSLTDNENKLGLNCVWRCLSEAEKTAVKLEKFYSSGSELEGMHRRERTALGAIKEIFKA